MSHPRRTLQYGRDTPHRRASPCGETIGRRLRLMYPRRFHRLVLLGAAFGDVWNTSLSIAADNDTDLGAVTPELLAAVAATVGTWYAGASTANGLRAGAVHSLTGIKLNRIGVDGRYVDDETMEHTYTTPITGGAALNPIPQAATVLSLLTSAARGPAHRGRMYLPPVDGYTIVQQDSGQALTASATRFANAGMDLVDRINDTYNATFPAFSEGEVVVASSVGAGRFRRVTRVAAGRVPDVMRSRRSALDENPVIVDVPA